MTTFYPCPFSVYPLNTKVIDWNGVTGTVNRLLTE